MWGVRSKNTMRSEIRGKEREVVIRCIVAMILQGTTLAFKLIETQRWRCSANRKGVGGKCFLPLGSGGSEICTWKGVTRSGACKIVKPRLRAYQTTQKKKIKTEGRGEEEKDIFAMPQKSSPLGAVV